MGTREQPHPLAASAPAPPQGNAEHEGEQAFVERVARGVVARGLTVPAILFLESSKPLNLVAAQGLMAASPLLRLLVAAADLEQLTALLERRDSIERLLVAIEGCEARTRAPKARGGAP